VLAYPLQVPTVRYLVTTGISANPQNDLSLDITAARCAITPGLEAGIFLFSCGPKLGQVKPIYDENDVHDKKQQIIVLQFSNVMFNVNIRNDIKQWLKICLFLSLNCALNA